MSREMMFTPMSSAEIRAMDIDGKEMIVGWPVVWDHLSEDMGGFREVVDRGAFVDYLNGGGDVVAAWNHNRDHILGRRSAGTLELEQDERGLFMRLDPVKSAIGVHALESIKRGDVPGASFGFNLQSKEGEKWEMRDKTPVRRLKSLILHEVSPGVPNPAYSASSMAVRSLEAFLQEVKASEEEKENRIQVAKCRLMLAERV